MPGIFKANPNDGTEYTRDTSVPNPTVTLFPMSMNCYKVMALIDMSTIKDRTTTKFIDVSGVAPGNYTLDFARLNPIMTVPVLEIDNKVITDSYYIYKHLLDNFPGEGDKKVQARGAALKDMQAFIDQVDAWDEIMYTYGNEGAPEDMHNMCNEMRLVRLRAGYAEAAALPDERLPAGGTLKEAFVSKLAGITYFFGLTSDKMPEAKAAKVKQSKDDLRNIYKEAEKLLERYSPDGGYLLCDKPSSGDAMLLAVVHRVNGMYEADAKALFTDFPRVQRWWTLMQSTAEAKTVLQQTVGRLMANHALFEWCVPCRMIAFKLGLIKAPALPKEVQDTVNAKVQEMKRKHGTA